MQQGGSLTVDGPLTVNGNSVTAGRAARARRRHHGTAGSAFGSGLFLQGNGTVTFSPGSGQTQTVCDAIADQTGRRGAAQRNWALSKTGAGTLVLGGTNTYTGGTTVDAGTRAAGRRRQPGLDGRADACNGGTFDLNDNNQTVSSLSGSAARSISAPAP